MRALHLVRSLFIGLLVAVLIPSPARAQITVDQFFPLIEDYQFRKLAEVSATEKEAAIGPFSSALLDEYILLSYSRWAVQEEDVPSSPPLEVQIYEMKDTLGAFGIFSLWPSLLKDAPQQRLDLPVDNYSSAQGLAFWRGNYLFHLSAPNPAASSPSLLELAQVLIEAIPLLNLHPVTVIHLPKDDLIQESIRFHLGESSFALNEDFPEALAAEIGFDNQVEVTLARYGENGHELFMLGYPTASLAEDHFTRLHKALEGYFSDEGVYMKRTGLIVSIFFGPETRAEEILAKIHYLPTIKWLYQKDQDAEDMRRTITSFLGLLRNTAATFAFFASLSIVLGLTAGLARIKMVKRFPQLFNKGKPILLKLD